MEYICQHCGSDLDGGDIFKYFLLEYGDELKARETAAKYGWTETNKKHFNRCVIVQPYGGSQYTMCPDCKQKKPFTAKL